MTAVAGYVLNNPGGNQSNTATVGGGAADNSRLRSHLNEQKQMQQQFNQ